MGCGCKKIQGTIYCTECGTGLIISYKEKEDPLVAAKNKHKSCANCGNTNFKLEA